jgi:hypothetical protein
VTLPQDVCVVQGHFRPHQYDDVPGAFRFTFLREPAALLLFTIA